MTVLFKTLKADIRDIFDVMSQCESFRTTGDCSIHHPSHSAVEE